MKDDDDMSYEECLNELFEMGCISIETGPIPISPEFEIVIGDMSEYTGTNRGDVYKHEDNVVYARFSNVSTSNQTESRS